MRDLKQVMMKVIRDLGMIAGYARGRIKRLQDRINPYGKEFFDMVERREGPSARRAAQVIVKFIHPGSVIDLGCGCGTYLLPFREEGIECLGLELSKEGLKRCRQRKMPVRRFDIRKDALKTGEKFELCICFEVAEHLPCRFSDRLVGLVTQLSDLALFTAAPPGQEGTSHVNEQPKEFWIEKFGEKDFVLDEKLTGDIKKQWEEGEVIEWLCRNLMVFRRSGG